jgi:nuclear pore complex protein Nup214
MTLSVSSSLVLLAGDKHTRETYNMNADKSKSMFSHIEEPKSVLINETKSIQQNETNLNKKSAVSTVSPTQTSLFPKKPKGIFVSTYSTALAKSAIESLKHGPANTKGSFFKSASKNHEPPCSSVGATPVAPALPGKVPHINVATSTSQPSEKASSSPAVSISLSVSSSTMINISANIPSSVSTLISSGTMPSSTASTSLSSVSFSPVLPSSSPLSSQAPKTVLPSYTPSLTSETSKELQPPLGKNSTF